MEQSNVPNGVKTIIINPGKIDTQMQEIIRNSNENDFPLVDRFITYKNNGDLAKAEDVASGIYNIIDTVPINGGFYLVQ